MSRVLGRRYEFVHETVEEAYASRAAVRRAGGSSTRG